MIIVQCVEKFRDNNGVIKGYRLQDSAGVIKEVTPNALKSAIVGGRVHVINLKLTQDGKLIDHDSSKDKIQVRSTAPRHLSANTIDSMANKLESQYDIPDEVQKVKLQGTRDANGTLRPNHDSYCKFVQNYMKAAEKVAGRR